MTIPPGEALRTKPYVLRPQAREDRRAEVREDRKASQRLFNGLDLPALGYACTQHVATPRATHIVLTRT